MHVLHAAPHAAPPGRLTDQAPGQATCKKRRDHMRAWLPEQIQPLLPAEAFSGAVLATGAELVLSAPGVAQALRVPLAPQREREIRCVRPNPHSASINWHGLASHVLSVQLPLSTAA